MDNPRTLKQNAAIHVLFRDLAKCLNDGGFDMKATLKPEVEIPWTEEMVKEHLFKPVMKVMLGKDSTADATTTDYSAVYDVVARHLAQSLGITPPPFPSHWTQGQEADL